MSRLSEKWVEETSYDRTCDEYQIMELYIPPELFHGVYVSKLEELVQGVFCED